VDCESSRKDNLTLIVNKFTGGEVMSSKKATIVGIGETTYSKNSGMSSVELLLQASERAAQDAGLKLQDIDGLILTDATIDLKAYDYQFYTKTHLKFAAFTTMSAGAGIVNSIELAQLAIENGEADYILIYAGANQVSESYKFTPSKMHGDDLYKRNLEIPMGYFPQSAYFGTLAQRYFSLYDNIEEQLGAIAVNQRKHALLNGNAQMKKPMSINDYFHSPLLADPLRIADCCLVTDGAAAIIVTSEEKAKDLRKPGIHVLGAATAGLDVISPYFFTQAENPLVTAAAKSGPLAMAKAGVTHKDIDVLEIYDCFTIAVVLQLEDLGFFPKGEAKGFIGDGNQLAFNGSFPLNTHGGLLSQGFVFGLNHVIEAVKQLRREAGAAQVSDPEVALVAGLGGWNHGTLILGRD
jgi:acetyl-CoA acetyltransferase